MILAALVGRSFGRARGLLLTLTLVLMAFQVMVVAAGRYLRDTGAFATLVSAMPVFVQQIAGPFFSGFGSMVAFGYFHPVVIIVFVGTAILVASEPAADVESGIVDLVLARPIRRWRIVARSLVMTALTTTAMAGLMVAASRVSMLFLAPEGASLPMSTLVRLAANLVAVAWIMGAVSLATATVVRRRSIAAGIAALAALVLYLLNLLAEIWPAMSRYGRASPFHYYRPTLIMTGVGTGWAIDVAILVS